MENTFVIGNTVIQKVVTPRNTVTKPDELEDPAQCTICNSNDAGCYNDKAIEILRALIRESIPTFVELNNSLNLCSRCEKGILNYHRLCSIVRVAKSKFIDAIRRSQQKRDEAKGSAKSTVPLKTDQHQGQAIGKRNVPAVENTAPSTSNETETGEVLKELRIESWTENGNQSPRKEQDEFSSDTDQDEDSQYIPDLDDDVNSDFRPSDDVQQDINEISMANKWEEKGSNESKFACTAENCNATFWFQNALEAHCETAHTTKSPQMRKRTKLQNQGIFFCSSDDCSASFKDRDKFMEHIRNVHQTRSESATDSPLYTCEFEGCDKDFRSKSSRWNHVALKHAPPQIRCPECSKYCPTEENLKAHMQIHRGLPKLQCTMCDKICSSMGQLYQHRQTHDKQPKHVCEICGQAYSLLGSLLRHKLSKHEEKKFACNECDKKFHLSYHLREHISFVHRGEKRFKCDQCDRRYVTRYSLNEHIDLIHKKLPPRRLVYCPICENRKFDRKHLLRKHMMKKHNSAMIGTDTGDSQQESGQFEDDNEDQLMAEAAQSLDEMFQSSNQKEN